MPETANPDVDLTPSFQKMRIAIDAVGIRMGGGASLLCDLLRWLPFQRQEWQLVFYLLPREKRHFTEPLAQPRVSIEYVPLGNSSGGRLLWLTRELPKRLLRAPVDVLFSFANIGTTRPLVPQVVYVHQPLAFANRGVPEERFLSNTKLWLLRAMIVRGALNSDSVIVQTSDMRSRLEENEVRLRGRISVIPGSVSELQPSESICSAKRGMIDQLAWPRLLYVAHPAEHKNHRMLLRAMSQLLRQFPNANLMLTLESQEAKSRADRKYITELQSLVQDLEIGDRIVWLGTLNQAEVRYALRQCTIAVFPSLDESFGLPIAEALTEGCALAVSDRNYARDVAGNAAIYFDPLDPKSIASELIHLLSQTRLIERLKQEASRRAVRFSPASVTERIANVLETAALARAPQSDSVASGQ